MRDEQSRKGEPLSPYTAADANVDESIFRKIVELAPNAIVLVDSDGRIVLVNAQTEKLFGFERDELLGRLVEMLVPVRFRGRHPGFREGFFGSPSARPMGAGRDLYGMRKDGTEMPLEIGLNPIETEHGTLTLGSIIDITERKKAEADLRAAERDALTQKEAEEERERQRTLELQRLAELERFQKLTVGRELKMIELKKELEELRAARPETKG